MWAKAESRDGGATAESPWQTDIAESMRRSYNGESQQRPRPLPAESHSLGGTEQEGSSPLSLLCRAPPTDPGALGTLPLCLFLLCQLCSLPVCPSAGGPFPLLSGLTPLPLF